ncbi:unnamed protein product [Acanthosepion pharaonis]|uniref:PDZ domain-containing protein n=1 Tax=Acanthosepion pharaonis TaxID=158019 RepID=A0A812B1B7_ACAPH|nr:unnamed protein product [Sepia pharaonis]
MSVFLPQNTLLPVYVYVMVGIDVSQNIDFSISPEAPKPKDSGKKIRRKLPPIPADEEPATTPRAPAQKKSPSSSVPPAPSRKAPTIKAVKGSPHGDNETVSHKDDSSREAGHPSQSVKSTSSSLSGVGRTNGNHSLRANSAGNGSGTGPCTSKQKTVGGPNGTTSKGGNGRNGRQSDGGPMKAPIPSNSRMGTGNGGRQSGAVNGRKTSEKQAIGKHDAKSVVAYQSSTVEQKVSDRRWHLHVTPPGSLSDEFTQDDNDQIIDSLVGIYGIPISTAMKSLKRRLQDELRKVTESRRRKIEELEEIHALERQIEELKLESKLDSRAAALLASGHKSRTLPRNGRGLVTSSSFDKSTASVRSSPQIIPRRSRHRRQASDPMIAKFSPIKEDKDIEADFQARGATEGMEGKFSKYSTDDSSQSGLSDTESTRSEPIGETINSAYKKIKPSAYAKMFYTGRAQSTERIHPSDSAQYLSTSAPLSSSHSESYLADGLAGHLKTPTYFSDDEEKRTKEEKRQILQYEIEKRKKQLEETARLQHELIRLSRARQAVAHSYDDIPRRYAYSTSPRHVPTGIIKPLDDDLPPQLERFVQSTHDIRKSESMDAKRVQELYQAQANYSSTEYLAHKQELARRQLYDDYSTYGSYPPYDAGLSQSQVYPSSPNLMNRSDSGPVIIPNIPPGLHPPGISGSVTLPDINRSDMDIMPTRELHQHQFSSDTDNSPASDYTPAMPLLDDITTRSRKILHDIGSRPLSAEFNLPGGVDDLMNAMYRVESDNSVDADEPIMKHMMEGGVTILKQLERKKQPAPTQPKRYPFVTKRILLTRDPKDKSIKGNGIGMKIVGGKHQSPDEEMVAYVAAIYPGGIAEQLHGELEEGDQILEWNGIELTGKTYEEVQQIISQPNGEIELVVRPGTKLCPKDGEGSNLQDGSCHSSYDNLEYISDDDDEYV